MFFKFAVCSLMLVCVCATAVMGGGVPYGSPHRIDALALHGTGEAEASAISDNAGAKAAASRINNLRWRELDQYGHEIGKPLLVRPYGTLTSLYAAALPPRSFVGKIDPAFVKDSYGNVKFIGESSIGVAAI